MTNRLLRRTWFCGGGRGSGAFTMIELLIVVVVVILLLGILAPAFKTVKDKSYQVVCKANLDHIMIGIKNYEKEHGRIHQSPNYNYWDWPLGVPLGPDEYRGGAYNAYWGIAYAPYLGGQRETFLCPKAQAVDCDPGWTDFKNQPWVTYGFNGYINGLGASRTLQHLKKPDETIITQDSYETLMDGGTSDTLSAWGSSMNITQWRNCGRGSCTVPSKNHEEEYYRHLGYCNVAWCDGHVTAVLESFGTDVPKEWYTGD